MEGSTLDRTLSSTEVRAADAAMPLLVSRLRPALLPLVLLLLLLCALPSLLKLLAMPSPFLGAQASSRRWWRSKIEAGCTDHQDDGDDHQHSASALPEAIRVTI